MQQIATDEIHLGFTGTREGMRYFQLKEFKSVMKDFCKRNLTTDKFFHHGDCVGADAQAHKVAMDLGFTVIIHPPTDTKFRAYSVGDSILPPEDYLARNRAIVDASHLVIGAPKSSAEELRSGTWMTIRYARDKEKLYRIINP